MTRALVSLNRFRDSAGLHIAPDGSAYLDAATCRKMARQLWRLAADLEAAPAGASLFSGADFPGAATPGAAAQICRRGAGSP